MREFSEGFQFVAIVVLMSLMIEAAVQCDWFLATIHFFFVTISSVVVVLDRQKPPQTENVSLEGERQ